MKEWQKSKPELFKKRVYNLSGLDKMVRHKHTHHRRHHKEQQPQPQRTPPSLIDQEFYQPSINICARQIIRAVSLFNWLQK
jgi:hypothetical protein